MGELLIMALLAGGVPAISVNPVLALGANAVTRTGPALALWFGTMRYAAVASMPMPPPLAVPAQPLNP